MNGIGHREFVPCDFAAWRMRAAQVCASGLRMLSLDDSSVLPDRESEPLYLKTLRIVYDPVNFQHVSLIARLFSRAFVNHSDEGDIAGLATVIKALSQITLVLPELQINLQFISVEAEKESHDGTTEVDLHLFLDAAPGSVQIRWMETLMYRLDAEGKMVERWQTPARRAFETAASASSSSLIALQVQISGGSIMKRLTLLTIVVGLFFGTLNSVAALPPPILRYPDSAPSLQAASYYDRFVSPNFTVTCEPPVNPFHLWVNGTIVEERNLPAGATVITSEFFDGVLSGQVSQIQSGSGSFTHGGTIRQIYAYPASYSERMETVINGQLVYSSTWSAYCSGPGTGTIDLVNQALAGACVPIPDGSVVGDLPAGAQAYYAPGKISPDVFLNPGTYWVIGEDESGQYYQILLACQYLWVPIDTMQPSYQPPWSGQPLPTRAVS